MYNNYKYNIIILLDDELYSDYVGAVDVFVRTNDRECIAAQKYRPVDRRWKYYRLVTTMPTGYYISGEIEQEAGVRFEITKSGDKFAVVADFADLTAFNDEPMVSKYKPLSQMTAEDLAHALRYVVHFDSMEDALAFTDMFIRQLQLGIIGWDFEELENVIGGGQLEAVVMTGDAIKINEMKQQISTADGIMLFLELWDETLINDGLIRYPREIALHGQDNGDCEMNYGAIGASTDKPERIACIFRNCSKGLPNQSS